MSILFPPPHLLSSHAYSRLRVGLLGGSFNPPHDGHLHISETARRVLNLDCVWWLVSPQNPLKPAGYTQPFESRMTQCLNLARGKPYIVVTDIEDRLGTNRTVDTLGRLLPRFPLTEFVWIAGYDNALTFHHWHRWRTIPDLMAVAFVARPPALSLTRNFPLKSWAGQGQFWLEKSYSAPLENNLTYWIISNKLNNQSSSTLRGKKVP